jgi:hypothetical protein
MQYTVNRIPKEKDVLLSFQKIQETDRKENRSSCKVGKVPGLFVTTAVFDNEEDAVGWLQANTVLGGPAKAVTVGEWWYILASCP